MEVGGGEVRVVVSGPCEAGEMEISREFEVSEETKDAGMEMQGGKVSGRWGTLTVLMRPSPAWSLEKEEPGPSSSSEPASIESLLSLCKCSLSSRLELFPKDAVLSSSSSSSILTIMVESVALSMLSISSLTELHSSWASRPRPTMGSILADWDDMRGLTILTATGNRLKPPFTTEFVLKAWRQQLRWLLLAKGLETLASVQPCA